MSVSSRRRKPKRNYRREYDKFQSSRTQKKRRAKRNKDRRAAVKAGKVSKPTKGNRGNGLKKKEVHHSKNGRTTILPASKNRGMAGEGGRRKGVRKKRK